MWVPRYPKSLQEIIRVIAIHQKLKASEISRITGFHKQTVYKGLSKLVEDDVIEIIGDGINQYQLSDNVNSDQILKFFESEQEYGISTIHGESIDSVKIPNSFRGTFFDFGFVPRKGVYGCQIFLESIPTSTIALLRNFTDMLKTLHYRLEEIYWTIDTYYGPQGSEFGVGIESIIKTIAQESEQKKAAINISFVVQDFFGGYFGFLYNVQARWINQGLNKGILDNIELFVVLDKIPIAKEFAISWTKKGMLPFVEEFTVEPEKILDSQVKLHESNILGFVERFGHEIIVAIQPRRGLPSKLLVRTRFASIAIEDLTSGQPYRLTVVKFKINPRFSTDQLREFSKSSDIELFCGMISELT